jgi:FKBP-type peptidyl-prolyl cis-trans isomerase FklB
MRHILAVTLMVVMGVATSWSAEVSTLNDEKSRESYSLGYEFGNNLKRNGVEINVNIFFSAIQEALEGKKPALSAEEMYSTILRQRKRLAALQDARLREFASKNLEEGKAFLAANKTKDGVKTLPSGLQYKVVNDGKGPIPKAADSVTVNYRGTLIDGKEFDSSRRKKGPVSLPVRGTIKGWAEALQLMKVGSTWQIFVPSDLAYGRRQFDKIPPNSVLIFDLELVSIADVSEMDEADMESGDDNIPNDG